MELSFSQMCTDSRVLMGSVGGGDNFGVLFIRILLFWNGSVARQPETTSISLHHSPLVNITSPLSAVTVSNTHLAAPVFCHNRRKHTQLQKHFVPPSKNLIVCYVRAAINCKSQVYTGKGIVAPISLVHSSWCVSCHCNFTTKPRGARADLPDQVQLRAA